MRYGHTAVLLDDTIYIWGGRNDTEGACNVLYAFDISKYTLRLLPALLQCSDCQEEGVICTTESWPWQGVD